MKNKKAASEKFISTAIWIVVFLLLLAGLYLLIKNLFG